MEDSNGNFQSTLVSCWDEATERVRKMGRREKCSSCFFARAQGHSPVASELGIKCEVTTSRIPSIAVRF